MKCLKLDEFIKRTTSAKETELLRLELREHVKGRPGLQGRTLCDRVIRACNHHLGVGPSEPAHVTELVKLVKVAVDGYDAAGNGAPQSSPFYLEKIVFHILKKLRALEVHVLCNAVAELLHTRLLEAEQCDELRTLAWSTFSVLWYGLSAAKEETAPAPRDKLRCQLRAVSFLLLLDPASANSSVRNSPVYAQDAILQFQNGGAMTKEDAVFLSEEIRTCFWKVVDESGAPKQRKRSNLHPILHVVLIATKVLCKAGHYDTASNLLDATERHVKERTDCPCAALVLGRLAVKIHAALKTPQREAGQLLTACARVLRSASALGDDEAGAVLEGCGLVVWVVESGHGKALSGPLLLALFSFLEEHQERLSKVLKKNSICQIENGKLQQIVCVSLYQGLVFAYESMQASQLEDSATLDRVLLYCQASAAQMMREFQKLDSESLCTKAVVAVSNLACGLYNRRLYEPAFVLLEILCKDLCRNTPASLSADRLSRPFMIAVQTSRRTGRLEQALDWVILWLKALGDNITAHMSEPVALWVKTKMDAANNADEDIRLRTLRDGFGPDAPEEAVMLSLLEEELRAYKETPGDTAQERYNTLCDLLEICHEESPHTHLRAVYLCHMAQVVCFQDFSEQTDCSAVDFTHEALRLLEAEERTPENSDKLTDDKAHALLWLYICSLEKNLQEAIARDQQQRDQSQSTTHQAWTNDLEYEDEQKNQESVVVYEGLHFSLDAQNKQSQPLEQAFSDWTALLKSGIVPSVRNPKQTCSSIALMAALFRLMGKPLKAAEAYQLAIRLAQELGDAQSCAAYLCQCAGLLLDLGSPDIALAQIEKAEKCLSSESGAVGPSSCSVLLTLLKSQYYYSSGQVSLGVSYLCEVLKEANEQKQSKSWYLLRARTLQTVGSYLLLDTKTLPHAQRTLLHQHGFSSPDTAVYESLKLFCSLLVTLVGKGLYGNAGSADVRFVNQGENLCLKWQLLCDLLSCSLQMVAVRSHAGAVTDARLQCLEALKLAVKLQALSQCAELLVLKAELELMQGDTMGSRLDLDRVRDLLERCTDVSGQKQKPEMKIKPRKGRSAQKPDSPLPAVGDDLGGFLSTRRITKQLVWSDQTSPPTLKCRPRRLSALSHELDCGCCICLEPCLGRVTVRWAAALADLDLRLDPDQTKPGEKLHWLALARSKNVSAKLWAKLAAVFAVKAPAKPSFLHDVVARIYLRIASCGLDPRMSKNCSAWKGLEAGLAFVESTPDPVVQPVKAGLMATKAILSLVTLASNKGCPPEELFSHFWSWKLPKKMRKIVPPTPSTKKDAAAKAKDGDKHDKTKELKKLKVVKTRVDSSSSSSRARTPVPMTPVMPRSKSTSGELSVFDFNTAVPTLACTPANKFKPPASARKVPRTASKFQVYQELSPEQEPTGPVPAAPRRIRRLRFKVEFSDESDSEADPPPTTKDVPKTRSAKKSVHSGRTPTALDKTPAAKKRPERKKSTAGAAPVTSSEDEAPARKGRSLRATRGAKADGDDEPDKMRTIDEEATEAFDMSIEELRQSDAENDEEASAALDTDFEILRHDRTFGLGKGVLFELKTRAHPAEGAQTPLPHDHFNPDDLSLEEVKSLLSSAWSLLQHCPSPNIYSSVCALLALATGQHDPHTAAMLHIQSLGISSRHRTLRHFAHSLKKLNKNSTHELQERLSSLSLNEPSPDDSGSSAAQRLKQLEKVFSFTSADDSDATEQFTQQIQQLPPGVVVCVLSAVGLKPGQMGDCLLLSRLEKDCVPVTVQIPSSRRQRPLSWMVQEIDSIQVEQKVVSSVGEKAKWWEGRRFLDERVEVLLNEMELMLTCWKSLLLPLSSDSELDAQVHTLHTALTARDVHLNLHMLKALLSAAPVLSEDDLRAFAFGVCPQWDSHCEQLLQDAVSQLLDRDEPAGHVVLILDKHLHKLPWETVSFLKSRSVSRMPSLHSLIALSIDKEITPRSVLKQGVDTKEVFYVLDPDGNLENSKDRFKECFSSRSDWDGVCGEAPDSAKLMEAVSAKDLYIYVGHGAGARFLDSQAVLKQQMRAASLLFGCSSAALAARGEQEAQGIVLYYLTAGCPFVLGNLWDVTDRDIDRFTKALLESWFGSGPGAPLLDFMGPARQAPILKHLIGAAPVVYGLPIHLL
ncbi:separin [Eucyclogobius newberryi]|uniref:separin n=1 Tax=Eucyclogobius newberryi TaxID=166745 RepID=UPI003B5AF3B4